ncbi:MAG: M20 family metallopeptidase [Terriglobia bacterium]
MNPRDLLVWCRSHTEAMLAMLRASVEIESPSSSKASVTRMAAFAAREFESAGARVETHRHPRAGDSITANLWPGKPKPLLVLAHTDTVWDEGALASMPFRTAAGRAYGPGILDMKSGIVIGIWAVRALKSAEIQPRGPVRFFLNSDEETGSLAFRSRILSEARRARACLVLEPAAEGGALKTSRKGVGIFHITVRGRSAHAGINPAAGVNAISEMARQIARIESLGRAAARTRDGLSINVGMVQGGSRSNVVPEKATASIDVRVARGRDGEWIERRMRALKPFDGRTQIEVAGGMNRPPMERRQSAALFRHAGELARQLGFSVDEAATGGGSDGSFAAALGVPTLDGMGGVGDGAHARHEHVLIRELPRRAALLAALLATI